MACLLGKNDWRSLVIKSSCAPRAILSSALRQTRRQVLVATRLLRYNVGGFRRTELPTNGADHIAARMFYRSALSQRDPKHYLGAYRVTSVPGLHTEGYRRSEEHKGRLEALRVQLGKRHDALCVCDHTNVSDRTCCETSIPSIANTHYRRQSDQPFAKKPQCVLLVYNWGTLRISVRDVTPSAASTVRGLFVEPIIPRIEGK
jgi:hypothetical protein